MQVTGSTTTVSVSDKPTAEATATLLTVEAIDTKPAGGNRKLAQTGTRITANGPLSALAVRVSVCGSAPSYSLSVGTWPLNGIGSGVGHV